MPDLTPRYGLKKPVQDGSETADLRVWVGENMDLIDAAVGQAQDTADAAGQAAAAAQQAANTAQTSANAAQAAADAAQYTADQALAAAGAAHSAANTAQQTADAALSAASAAQSAAQAAQSTADAAQAAASAAQATADLAVDAGLAVEAVLPVEGAEPEQVQTAMGPAVQFAAGMDQAVMFCRRWPFSGQALAMELVLAASEASAGSFQVQVGYQINGGEATNVVQQVTPGATTSLYTADLGEIIPAASLPAGALVAITLSRLGADEADTHPGTLLIYHCRLRRG